MIIPQFPSAQASQRTSVISQSYCGLSCVYTRVWCHTNDYISLFFSTMWVKRLHPGKTTIVVVVSHHLTWPLAVSRDRSGFVYVFVQSSYIVSALSRLHISLWPWVLANGSHVHPVSAMVHSQPVTLSLSHLRWSLWVLNLLSYWE